MMLGIFSISEVLPKILIVTGLIFDIVGVCLLAYDALYKAGHNFWLNNYDRYLHDAVRQRDIELDTWNRMESKGASKEYILRLKTESEEKYKSCYDGIQRKINDLRDVYPRKVSFLAFRGIIIVVLGFLFQIFGTIFS